MPKRAANRVGLASKGPSAKKTKETSALSQAVNPGRASIRLTPELRKALGQAVACCRETRLKGEAARAATPQKKLLRDSPPSAHSNTNTELLHADRHRTNQTDPDR
jgi:hypothetical protein